MSFIKWESARVCLLCGNVARGSPAKMERLTASTSNKAKLKNMSSTKKEYGREIQFKMPKTVAHVQVDPCLMFSGKFLDAGIQIDTLVANNIEAPIAQWLPLESFLVTTVTKVDFQHMSLWGKAPLHEEM